MPKNAGVSGKQRPPVVEFLLKGLAIALPPILTLVILIWIGRGVNDYIIQPIATVVRFGIAQLIDNSVSTRSLIRLPDAPPLPHCGTNYLVSKEDAKWVREFLENAKVEEMPSQVLDIKYQSVLSCVYVPIGRGDRAVPYTEFEQVASRLSPEKMPRTILAFYMELAEVRNPFGYVGLSVLAVSMAVIGLYYIGRIGTARVGAWVVAKFEGTFFRLPLVSNVYLPVKQVTEFLFSERTVQYNRVVAVEYPRRGMWSLGFVTGEGMLQITAAAGEPMVSVLVPTSPAPFTGFTVCVPRSDVIDLDLTIDQAIQFCVSCGVHVAPQQRVTPELLQKELAKRLAAAGEPLFRKPPKVQTTDEQQKGKSEGGEGSSGETTKTAERDQQEHGSGSENGTAADGDETV